MNTLEKPNHKEARNPVPSRVFFFLALTIVVLAVAGGTVITGGPFQQRLVKFDEERVERLREVSRAVEVYYSGNKKTLPSDLFELERYLQTQLSVGLRPHATEDPETRKHFEYQVSAKDAYKLCAVFATANLDTPNNVGNGFSKYSYYTGNFTGRHPEGRHCFEFKIAAEGK